MRRRMPEWRRRYDPRAPQGCVGGRSGTAGLARGAESNRGRVDPADNRGHRSGQRPLESRRLLMPTRHDTSTRPGCRLASRAHDAPANDDVVHDATRPERAIRRLRLPERRMLRRGAGRGTERPSTHVAANEARHCSEKPLRGNDLRGARRRSSVMSAWFGLRVSTPWPRTWRHGMARGDIARHGPARTARVGDVAGYSSVSRRWSWPSSIMSVGLVPLLVT